MREFWPNRHPFWPQSLHTLRGVLAVVLVMIARQSITLSLKQVVIRIDHKKVLPYLSPVRRRTARGYSCVQRMDDPDGQHHRHHVEYYSRGLTAMDWLLGAVQSFRPHPPQLCRREDELGLRFH